MTPRNADHRWFEVRYDGLPTITTKLPNHKDDIGKKLEGRICKQLRVRKAFFGELMDCTKSRQDYERQLQTDPYPPFDVLIV